MGHVSMEGTQKATVLCRFLHAGVGADFKTCRFLKEACLPKDSLLGSKEYIKDL